MVKHQRRSHLRGLNSNELLDDCTSDSDMDESPGTPQSAMNWPIHSIVPSQAPPSGQVHNIHRAASFADYGAHMQNNYMQQFPQRHSVDVADFNNAPMMQRTQGMQAYYVVEEGNPGIATMNTNVQAFIPRQQTERPTIEIPYGSAGLATPIHSSPSFSPTSSQGSLLPEGLYTHQGPQAATYALQSAAVEQPRSMVQYACPQPSPTNNGTQQYPTPEAESEAWLQYQTPVEVATIGHLPAYGSGVFDLYGGPKLEFEDPSMQLPSSRLESM